MIKETFIETDRLLIRPYQESDLPEAVNHYFEALITTPPPRSNFQKCLGDGGLNYG